MHAERRNAFWPKCILVRCSAAHAENRFWGAKSIFCKSRSDPAFFKNWFYDGLSLFYQPIKSNMLPTLTILEAACYQLYYVNVVVLYLNLAIVDHFVAYLKLLFNYWSNILGYHFSTDWYTWLFNICFVR